MVGRTTISGHCHVRKLPVPATLSRGHAVTPSRYSALPSKRAWIPKTDGRLRPLGIAAREEKIVQMATVWILSAIYEQDFADFSYGFRPGRRLR